MTRYYDIRKPDGNKDKYPSVTTILSVLPKGEALKKWMDETPDYGRYTRNRATIGTIIHWRIAKHLSKKFNIPPPELSLDSIIITPDMKESIDVIWSYFLDAEREVDLKPVYLEKKIINHEHRYAGTADFLGKVNGIPALLDFKTFKGLFPDHSYGAQLAAYKRGAAEFYPAKELFILRMNENTGWELIPIADNWNLFLKALEKFNARGD